MKKKRKKQVVTLKDIAAATGYSVNTVSRALRGKDDIAEETTRIIKEKAASLGYVNNTIASSLRLGYTNTLAIILGDISNPHFSIMTKEIENYARSKGYLAFLLNTNESSKDEQDAIRLAVNKNVDGIIICPEQSDGSSLSLLHDLKIPFIQIGRRDPDDRYSYVICDDVNGGYLATRYLLDNGHRRILFLNAPAYVSSSRERQQGYCRALQERGIDPDPKLIREISLASNDVNEVLSRVFAEHLDFTAIFAFSDNVAWSVWTWLDQHGYAVPKDFSLIGYDHIQSQMAIPFPLATISSYKTSMSILAVDGLLQMINSEAGEAEVVQKILPTNLVLGCTVRNISAK
jgi:LacI family transcriptional regulator